MRVGNAIVEWAKLVTTEALIAEKPEKNPPTPAGGGGGMGGMGGGMGGMY